MSSPRIHRREIAEDTLRILEEGYYINPQGNKVEISEAQAACLVGTTLITPEAGDRVLEATLSGHKFQTIFEVTGETTLDAVRRLHEAGEDHLFCLNFASAKNPGGGFLGGSQAQEESLARSSGLYPTQMKTATSLYYTINRNNRTCLYTDHLIYSPAVPVFKEEDGTLMKNYLTCSILTAPAVNAGVVREREPQNIDKIEETMRQRIAKVLAIASQHRHEVLVLGAWGCGVFRNNPDEVAQWFYDALNDRFKGCFRRIIFAIYASNQGFIQPFRKLFSVRP